jgi:Integrase core domain
MTERSTGITSHRASRPRRSFNGRLRDELLNETLFASLNCARATLAAWRMDNNTERPHSRLGWQTPAAFAETFTPQRDLAGDTPAKSGPPKVSRRTFTTADQVSLNAVRK